MARKAIISKEQIITAAFDIAKVHGRNAITIREIGSILGVSTAPIYTQYPSMDTIMEDLVLLVNTKVVESTLKERTRNPFLNLGVGYLDFVIENRLIFNDFFLTMDNSVSEHKEDNHMYLEQMKKNPFMSFFDDDQLKSILFDMSVYTYGLATKICTTSDVKHELSYYQNLLEQNGDKLINYHLYSSGKFESVVQKLLEKFSKKIDIEEVLKK